MQVYGNWGLLICNPITGAVVAYDRSNSDYEHAGDGYDHIVAFDIVEWRHKYPGESIDRSIDILDIGYWYTTGDGLGYEPPAEDWRNKS